MTSAATLTMGDNETLTASPHTLHQILASGPVLDVLLQRHGHFDEAAPYFLEEVDHFVEIGVTGPLKPRRFLFGSRSFRLDSTGKRQIARDELFLKCGALALKTRDFRLQRRPLIR